MLIFRPQPIADTRLQPPGTAGALRRGGAGDAPRLEPRHAATGVEARHTRQPGVDHHPHALDGQAGLGDVGGQYHLAHTCRRRLDSRALVCQIQLAVQRAEQDIAAPFQRFGQRLVDPADLGLTRQEHQQAARLFVQRLQHRLQHPRFDPLARLKRPRPALRHREHAPFAAHDGRVVEQARQPLTFQRRRHQQQLERLVAQHQTRVERERQRQVGIQAALVEFVEDHQTDAFQAWVVLQTTGENAFGDHLDAGPGADLAVEANAIAHRLPDLFPQLAGQPLGRRPRRQPPRFEHQDALPGQPAFIQQRQRHAGGLAGAGRCLQHGFVTLMQRLAQGRQRLFDGQGGHGYSAVEAAIIRARMIKPLAEQGSIGPV